MNKTSAAERCVSFGGGPRSWFKLPGAENTSVAPPRAANKCLSVSHLRMWINTGQRRPRHLLFVVPAAISYLRAGWTASVLVRPEEPGTAAAGQEPTDEFLRPFSKRRGGPYRRWSSTQRLENHFHSFTSRQGGKRSEDPLLLRQSGFILKQMSCNGRLKQRLRLNGVKSQRHLAAVSAV